MPRVRSVRSKPKKKLPKRQGGLKVGRDPTPAEIRKACAKIREQWSELEHVMRYYGVTESEARQLFAVDFEPTTLNGLDHRVRSGDLNL